MKFSGIFSIIISASILLSCGDKQGDGFENKLDTDLINNPKSAEKTGAENNGASIEFAKDLYNFGTIKEGEKVKYSFSFTNSGTGDLIIGDAKGSCGCTVPKYPTQPIEPGKGGSIDVEFNSAGKSGHQRKTVSVITNANPSTRVLVIEGEVTPVAK